MMYYLIASDPQPGVTQRQVADVYKRVETWWGQEPER
jgi:hypothetical protein